MESKDVLIDGFGRVRDVVHGAVEGLSPDQLTFRIDAEANTIAWLVWHLTRVQDDHVSEVAEVEQVWTAESWVDRLGLPFDRTDTGYGHARGDVGVVRADASLLLGYYDAVHAHTAEYLSKLTDADLDRVVDRRWDPPVTLGVRLVSVIADDLQHAGQAAFVRGVVLRRK
jgi:uncharacterized damage-inducible protein DinB